MLNYTTVIEYAIKTYGEYTDTFHAFMRGVGLYEIGTSDKKIAEYAEKHYSNDNEAYKAFFNGIEIARTEIDHNMSGLL